MREEKRHPTEKALEKARTLSEALPFMRRYAGETVVIKYGGHAMGNDNLSRLFAIDIVLLKQNILAINEVARMDDLHVWSLCQGQTFMSCQLYLTAAHAPPPASFHNSEIIVGEGMEPNKNRVKETYDKVMKILANYDI